MLPRSGYILSLSHSRSGDGSPPRSSPGSSIGVLGRFDSGDLAMTPAAPGRVLGSVTPDVLPSRQHHCCLRSTCSVFDVFGSDLTSSDADSMFAAGAIIHLPPTSSVQPLVDHSLRPCWFQEFLRDADRQEAWAGRGQPFILPADI